MRSVSLDARLCTLSAHENFRENRANALFHAVPPERLRAENANCLRVEPIRVSSVGYFRRYTTVVSVLAGSGVGSP